MLVVVPSYKHMFQDFKLKVPLVTEFVISISDWVLNYWYVLPFFVMPALALDVGIMLVSWRRKPWGRAFALLWLALPVVFMLLFGGLVYVGLELPSMKLREMLAR